MGAVRDGLVRVGDAIAVFGLGAIGLFIVQLAKIQGAKLVFAADLIELRREATTAVGPMVSLTQTLVMSHMRSKKQLISAVPM